MSAESELSKILMEMSEIYVKRQDETLSIGFYVPTIKRLAMEAQAIITRHFGAANTFSINLISATTLSENGLLGRSVESVFSEALQVIAGALNTIRREPFIGPNATVRTKPLYIDESRIAELGSLDCPSLDFSRLIQMCRELNMAYDANSFISVIFLVRAIIDHVAPLFGAPNLKEAANKLSLSKKRSVIHLDTSLRNMADSYLHLHIRRNEILPTASEVNFSQDLSVLLGEVVSMARSLPPNYQVAKLTKRNASGEIVP